MFGNMHNPSVKNMKKNNKKLRINYTKKSQTNNQKLNLQIQERKQNDLFFLNYQIGGGYHASYDPPPT
jgi:hypothetical protein